MAGGLQSVAALQTTIWRAAGDRSVCGVDVAQVQVGPEWAGGSFWGPLCDVAVKRGCEISAGRFSYRCMAVLRGGRGGEKNAGAAGASVGLYTVSWTRDAPW
jgi:hypothetical protein